VETPGMGHDTHRVHSVIAALKRVREHVAMNDETDEWDPDPYNRWVGMLEGILSREDAERIQIGNEWLTSAEYLMNIDACIAFLESEEPKIANTGTTIVDADFSETVTRPSRASLWPPRFSKLKPT
jgi:hypothetical protein